MQHTLGGKIVSDRILFVYSKDDLGVFSNTRIRYVLNSGIVRPGDMVRVVPNRDSNGRFRKEIDAAIRNTSVTVVLSGKFTYQRRWMRYTITKSLSEGRAMLDIKSHLVDDGWDAQVPEGPNPFLYLSFQIKGPRFNLFQLDPIFDTFWLPNNLLRDFPRSNVSYDLTGVKSALFSGLFEAYEWIEDDAVRNFPTWVQYATEIAAGTRPPYLAGEKPQ